MTRLTAADVVNRYFSARGGRRSLERLCSVEREGIITFYLADGIHKGRYYTCLEYPHNAIIEIETNRLNYREMLLHGAAFRYSYTDSHWRRCDKKKLAELTETALVANRELLYEAKHWQQATVAMVENGITVVADPLQSTQVKYRFSSATGLLVSKSRMHRERVYGDWRRVDDIQFPFAIDDFALGELAQSIRLNHLAHGLTLDHVWEKLGCEG